MEITNINIKENKIYITLSEIEKFQTFNVLFKERFEIGIWNYHKKIYQLNKIKDNEYEFDLLNILKKIRTCQDIVMDIKTETGFIETKLAPETISDKSKAISTSFGNLKCEFYKNGSSGISIKLRLSPIKFNLSFVKETKTHLIFFVSSSSIKYYLVRKNKSYENSFNFQIPLKVKDNEIKIDKKIFLNNVIEKEETWLIVSLNGEQVCYANFINVINLQTKIKHIDICLNSTNYNLTIKTTKNIDDTYNKIKICIIGSCFSRLAFRSEECYNPDYKSIYGVPLTFFHLSLATAMSDKIPYKKENLVGLKQKELDNYGEDFFEKNIFEKIQNYNPDYIIFDNYPNFSDDLIETTSGNFINNNYFLKDTIAIKNLEIKKVYKNTSDEYFEIFKKSLTKFKNKIKNIVPLEKIILIRSEPSSKKIENNILVDWENSQLIKLRKYLWNKFDSYFISHMENIKIIDMRNSEKYFSENIQYQPFSSNHLNSLYYKDLYNEINKIILIDQLKKHNN